MIKSIKDLAKTEIENKRVLMRVDFNVPLDASRNITDDSRIVAALPSIRYLLAAGARLILVTHLGRPDGEVVEKLRLDPIAKRLSDLLGTNVLKLNEAIGFDVKTQIDSLRSGQVVLLENIRFYAGEEENNDDFAKELASLADLYVNDAFGTAHRAHASTAGVASYLSPSVAGFLMLKEIEMLGAKLDNPERPFTAIIGGSKVSSKITVLKHLVKKVDTLIIGGGMAFTFLKAMGASVGKSICEEAHLETAREILALADQFNTALILPEDTLCTSAEDSAGQPINVFDAFKPNDLLPVQVLDSRAIDDKSQGMDIGPKTIENYKTLVSQSKTIVWNGPVGVFEYMSFENGTRAIAESLVELTNKGGITVVGGGDSVAALEKFGIPKENLSHVSTGGGASLEFLEGRVLPGVACLDGYDSQASAPSELKTKNFADELSKLVK